MTVHQLQQLCGYLNFLCRCVPPGRVFLTRLYNLISGNVKVLKPHHHICIKQENRLDLLVWQQFLNDPEVYSRPFMDMVEMKADSINMYSDTLGKLGFSTLCNYSWMFSEWNKNFLEQQEPSIKYLELFTLVVGVITWIHRFHNKRVCLYCDNMAVVHMINNTSAKCRNCIILLRIFVLKCLKENVKVSAQYVSSKNNSLTDSLSRLDFEQFRHLGPNMEKKPTTPPAQIWPVEQIWIPT